MPNSVNRDSVSTSRVRIEAEYFGLMRLSSLLEEVQQEQQRLQEVGRSAEQDLLDDDDEEHTKKPKRPLILGTFLFKYQTVDA